MFFRADMQNRNFVVFIVLSIAILVGWSFLSSQLWTRKKGPDGDPKKLDKKYYGPVAIARTVAQAGEGNLGGLLIDLAELAQRYPPPPTPRWRDYPEAFPPAIALGFPATPAALGSLAPWLPRPVAPSETVKSVIIGGDGYQLTATLTTRGAGVEKLVLNRFEGVNWLGRGTGANLELIQEDKERPSFLMYHYPTPASKHPVFTLGQQVWKLEKELKNADGV